MDSIKEKPEYRDLSEWVVLRILDAIRSGTILAGERLVERDIADRFDVSRAPVRDAFHRLERIGVLERKHPRGVSVLSWDEHDAMEIIYLIDALIFMSIKLAVGRLNDEDFDALEEIVEQTRQNMSAEPVDRRQQMALDIRFHEIIAHASGNQRLDAMLKRLTLPMDLWPQAFLQRIVPSFSYRQHAELLAVLKRGDRAAAVECVVRHQQETEALELAIFSRPADSEDEARSDTSDAARASGDRLSSGS